MNLLNVAQTAVIAAVSALLSLNMGFRERGSQDVVKAKQIEVVDSEGKIRAVLDYRGLSLYGYEAGSKGLDGTMLRISDGDQLRVSIGVHENAQSGMVAYGSEGMARSYLLTDGSRSVIALIGGEDRRKVKESFSGGFDGIAALKFDCSAEKAQVRISDPKRDTRVLDAGGPPVGQK